MTARIQKIAKRLAGPLVTASLVFGFSAPTIAAPAMWLIKDSDTEIYILGSIHVLRHGTYWRTLKVNVAFDKTNTVVLEIPIDPNSQFENQEALDKYAYYSGGDTLEKNIGKDAYAILESRVEKQIKKMEDLNAPEEAIAEIREKLPVMRPMTVALTIGGGAAERSPYAAFAGVDFQLAMTAIKRGKYVEGIESYDAHWKILKDIPNEIQVRLLKEALTEEGEAEQEALLDKLVAVWLKGDLEALAAAIEAESAEEDPIFNEVLLYRRNRAWVPKLKEYLDRPGVHFVVVGAGHLVGPNNVIELLESEGIKVERY